MVDNLRIAFYWGFIDGPLFFRCHHRIAYPLARVLFIVFLRVILYAQWRSYVFPQVNYPPCRSPSFFLDVVLLPLDFLRDCALMS